MSVLFDIGAKLGEEMMPDVVKRLKTPATSYGKAAIVGLAGEFEHGGAVIHPKLGKPMRAAIGGGEAIISSNVKVAPAGSAIDVPLAHKDNIWSFDHFDTMTDGRRRAAPGRDRGDHDRGRWRAPGPARRQGPYTLAPIQRRARLSAARESWFNSLRNLVGEPRIDSPDCA